MTLSVSKMSMASTWKSLLRNECVHVASVNFDFKCCGNISATWIRVALHDTIFGIVAGSFRDCLISSPRSLEWSINQPCHGSIKSGHGEVGEFLSGVLAHEWDSTNGEVS